MALIQRALISVSDKRGLLPFCQGLAALNVVILSTGGTAKLLREAGLPVTEVAEFTGFPEMLDGRVKTLHPKIHGGLLGLRDHPEHQRQMAEAAIEPIDLVVVNLYPFEATVAQPGCTLAEAIENIDIGGPAMLRSAAKNHRFVTVITDPADYPSILAEMRENGGQVSLASNARLAHKVFARTAAYDGAIANWLTAHDATATGQTRLFPDTLSMQFYKVQEMRYGENPHQLAAFYREADPREPSLANATILQGKALSYNNINDADAAFEAVKDFEQPAVVVVKHANPCGVAVDSDLLAAYRKARDTDPVSAFGGIIACNRPITGALAQEIATTFVEAVIAPAFAPEAREILAAKPNLRLLQTLDPAGYDRRQTTGNYTDFHLQRVVGGILVQERDRHLLTEADLRIVSQRPPSMGEIQDLLFAWKVVKQVKSNAIVYAKGLTTVGVGAGQMSRVDSSRIAVWKAKEAAQAAGRTDNPIAGAVIASDAFFPFRDGVDAAAAAGATAVIQPGGSMRDGEVIEAVNQHGMAMVFTGIRHFRH